MTSILGGFYTCVTEENHLQISMNWSDEATFKFNGTFNRHNCVYWATENRKVKEERVADLPGASVCCGISSKGMLRNSLQCRCQHCTGALVGHFEHL
jgi:hypothetical protein